MKWSFAIVEVCESNSINTEALEQFEKDHPETPVMRMECLNHCGLCRARPYVLVNGKIVASRTVSRCLERAAKEIAEIDAAYE